MFLGAGLPCDWEGGMMREANDGIPSRHLRRAPKEAWDSLITWATRLLRPGRGTILTERLVKGRMGFDAAEARAKEAALARR